MNRVLPALAAAGTAAVVALAVPAMAVSHHHTSQRGHDDSVRLKLVETTTAFHFIDAPAPDADGQAGDTITFESDLSTKSGAKKGTLEGHCIQIRADGTLDDCDVTVMLHGGSYRMSGPFDPASGGTLTITGGTGAFLGAGGTDMIANQPDGTAIHTIRIVGADH